jgi:crotonobetainyl-CoA:carnitine CoA-transferase CaiB-like acyl-CoA transferase
LLGADVIKVENPSDPDQARTSGSDLELNAAGMGTMFLAQASNKASIGVNLKSAGGQAVFRRMVRSSDVIVENYRPGSLECLGLGYTDLAADNPRLIHCSISAFGQTGPRRTETAYDHVIQASSGLMATTALDAEGEPVKWGAPAVDYATGTFAAFAIASALFQRERTGKGQRIDVAMFDVAATLMGIFFTSRSRTGWERRPHGNTFEGGAPWSGYWTKEGMVMLGAGNKRQRLRLWRFLKRPDLADAERSGQRKHVEEADFLKELMLTRTATEWEQLLQDNHIPAARVRTMSEAMVDPHFAARAPTATQKAEGIDGDFEVPLAGFKFAHDGPQLDSPPRPLGADTDRILVELGFDAEEISRLRANLDVG